MRYPQYGRCDCCKQGKTLVMGDGMGHAFCSATCLSAAQAPLDHSQERDEEQAMQRADDEELMAQGFYEHQEQCDGGLL